MNKRVLNSFLKLNKRVDQNRIKEFFKKQIDIDADLWLIEVVSKEADLTDLFLKQGL